MIIKQKGVEGAFIPRLKSRVSCAKRMNINQYALRKERSLQKIIKNQPKPNITAIGVCSEAQVTHHIITKRSDECLPISAFVPKHKEGDGKKFPVIIDIYGGNFVAGRSALNTNFGAWCAEQGYLTFIPEYTPVPETNLFGQLGDLLKAFVVIHRCAERYGADMSRMYLVGDGAGAALACLVYALLWNPVSMQHLEDELPFDVPQEAKLTFKAVCLQNSVSTPTRIERIRAMDKFHLGVLLNDIRHEPQKYPECHMAWIDWLNGQPKGTIIGKNF